MKVRNLLESPQNWTKLALYRDEKGRVLPSYAQDTQICSCCLVGALRSCYNINERPKIYEKIMGKLGKVFTTWQNAEFLIACWNDNPSRTYDEVINLCTELDI